MPTPTFTPPPTAPARSSPSTFRARMDAFLAWIVTAWGELSAFVIWAVALQADVADDKEAASDSAAAAAASAGGAAGSASDADASADLAAAYAATALAAPGTNATCSQNFNVPAVGANLTKLLDQAGKAFIDGMVLKFASRANGAHYFEGRLSGFNAGTGSVTLDVLAANGVGNAHADWNVFPTNDPLTNIASQAEAEAGTDNAKTMTALRTAQAIAALGRFAPDVVLAAEVASGGNLGTYASGAWRKQAVNTVRRNSGSLATLSSDQFTLPAGTYVYRHDFGYQGNSSTPSRVRTRLYNVTDAAVIDQGMNGVTFVPDNSGGGTQATMPAHSPLVTVFTLAATKTLRVEVYPTSVTVSNIDSSFGPLSNGANEVAGLIEITKAG